MQTLAIKNSQTALHIPQAGPVVARRLEELERIREWQERQGGQLKTEPLPQPQPLAAGNAVAAPVAPPQPELPPTLRLLQSLQPPPSVAVPLTPWERERLKREGFREWLEGERRLIDSARHLAEEFKNEQLARDCVKQVGWITLPDGTKLPDVRFVPCE